MQHLRALAEILPSGDWTYDNAAGVKLAATYVAEARRLNDPCLINAALRGIANAGRWTGVEVGFAFGLAGAVMS